MSNEEKEIDPRILKIASKIRALRIKNGYTSYENFALDHGIPPRQYFRLEKGVNFKFETLLHILDIHGVSVEEFFRE